MQGSAEERKELVRTKMETGQFDASNFHGARPVHLIITMIKWIRTSRLSIKNSLSAGECGGTEGVGADEDENGAVRRYAHVL